MSPIQLAAVLGGVVLVASMLSVELGVTVALIELTLGVIVGNVFQLHTADWLEFIAKFASIVLTFLAGMEVDPVYMRDRAKATVSIGVASFAGPFVVSSLVSYLFIGWTLKAVSATAVAAPRRRRAARRLLRSRPLRHGRDRAGHRCAGTPCCSDPRPDP